MCGCNLIKLISMLQVISKLQQAGKIDNLQELVRDVFGCVTEGMF